MTNSNDHDLVEEPCGCTGEYICAYHAVGLEPPTVALPTTEEPIRTRARKRLFYTRRARLIVSAAIVTGVYILIGVWAGAVTDGLFGALYIGGIALLTAALIWGIFAGIAALAVWIYRGEPRHG